MNNKKILIVDKEQNDILVSEIEKLLSTVGIGTDVMASDSPHGFGDWAALYAAVIVLYSHTDREVEQDASCRSRRLKTMFEHGKMSSAFGVRKVGVLYLPGSTPCLGGIWYYVKADAGSVWRVKLLNRLRDSGFEIDEQRFMHYAKRL